MILAKAWGISPREVRDLTNLEVALMWQTLDDIHEAEKGASRG